MRGACGQYCSCPVPFSFLGSSSHMLSTSGLQQFTRPAEDLSFYPFILILE